MQEHLRQLGDYDPSTQRSGKINDFLKTIQPNCVCIIALILRTLYFDIKET